MPNMVTFIRVSDSTPQSPKAINKLMCEHFGVEPFASHSYNNWYEELYWRLAQGRGFNELLSYYEFLDKEKNQDNSEHCREMRNVIKWLKELYRPQLCWMPRSEYTYKSWELVD